MPATYKKQRMRWFWPALYIVSPLLPVLLFLRGNWYTIGDPWTVAMVFGICGYIYLLNQFITSSRPRFLDRMYGLPKILRFHGMMAMVGIACIIVHRIIRKGVFAVEDTPQVILGTVAMAFFMLVIVATLLLMVGKLARKLALIAALQRWAHRRGIQYHHLRLLHNLTAVAALLAMLHVLLASSTRLHWSNTAVMAAWYGLAMVGYLRHKLLRPLANRRRPLVVTAVEQEADTVTTVRMRPTSDLNYHSGQFAYFRFQDGVPGREEHPFTISSALAAEQVRSSGQAAELTFTAKHSGDFSSRLTEVQAGATVILDGPYGRFSYIHAPSDAPLYFVAGGIGITPFLSMLADMDATGMDATGDGRPIHLVWAATRRADMIRFDWLQGLEQRVAGFHFTPVLLAEPSWEGRSGMITEELLREIIAADSVQQNGSAASAHWYMCGPPPMINAIRRHLQHIGVARRQLFSEEFGS